MGDNTDKALSMQFGAGELAGVAARPQRAFERGTERRPVRERAIDETASPLTEHEGASTGKSGAPARETVLRETVTPGSLTADRPQPIG